ncbi:MAG: protein phosphatase 2C domain-containing protein [Melioribacteraceae bacterium]|nr:serine/threonine-protein phosphatase [Melioribacteraceae bacterium]MDD3557129.1 protein phosphatase 2C domain-containing protein [Melioribacteraceae bacterium]
MSKIKFFAESFVGRRDNNQDSVAALDLGSNSYFFAVADGMGGVSGGQIASKIVIDTAKSILENQIANNLVSEKLKPLLTEIFVESQKKLYERISSEPELAGMGTTMTALLIVDGKYIWGNLGDSRIYRYQNSKIEQLSVDHTYIQDYKNENEGEIPKSIIEQYSHYLTKSLDGGADKPDIFPTNKDYEELESGEIFLLCSDGLITNKVEDKDEPLIDYIEKTKDLEEAAKQLIADAFHNGSTDNISVVMVEVDSIQRKGKLQKKYNYPPKENKTKRISRLTVLLITIIVLLIISIIIFSWIN